MIELVAKKLYNKKIRKLLNDMNSSKFPDNYKLDNDLLNFLNRVNYIERAVRQEELSHETAERKFKEIKSYVNERDFSIRNWDYDPKSKINIFVTRMKDRTRVYDIRNKYKSLPEDIKYQNLGFPLTAKKIEAEPKNKSLEYIPDFDLSSTDHKENINFKDLEYHVKNLDLWLISDKRIGLFLVEHYLTFDKIENQLEKRYISEKILIIRFDNDGNCVRCKQNDNAWQQVVSPFYANRRGYFKE
jgi:hypothetical protein